MASDANQITVNIHNAKPRVMEHGGLLWLDVPAHDVADVALFIRDPRVAIEVGEQLAAAGRRLAQIEDAKADAKAEPTAVEEPWVG